MNDTDLGKAMLRGERPVDSTKLSQRVLQRDRRRVGLLAVACVVAWMLVVIMPWVTFLPMMARVLRDLTELNPNSANVESTLGQQKSMLIILTIKRGTMATFVGSVTSMFMAAVCTVALVVLSRRATLRQLNASLAEISDQLKVLAARSG